MEITICDAYYQYMAAVYLSHIVLEISAHFQHHFEQNTLPFH